jgi:N-acetylglutamate synthase-like GNAT family acetyltransferase
MRAPPVARCEHGRVGEIAQIRYAEVQDRRALGNLHRRSSLVWEEDRPMLEAHPEVFGVAPEAIAEGRVRVAVNRDGQLVGFATVTVAEAGVCKLEDLFVEPEVMRRGVGSALVEDSAAAALAAGCRTMTVVAHPRNFPFYESVGFVPFEAAPTRFGPAVRMRRQL